MEKIIVITSEFFGQGDDELGAKLMGSFLRKLCQAEHRPKEIIFYNSAVKLLAKGSAVLDAVEMLAGKGVRLTACGTCVGYYELQNVLDCVEVGDMAGIIGELMSSSQVITV